MRGDGRPVSELKRDAENSRADLTITVDQLRAKVSDTVDDIRERISPEGMKAAAGEYLRVRGEQLMDKARENPLQAAAVMAGLSYPIWRIARSIPAPIWMVGAGLFLMGTTSGKNISRQIAERGIDVADRVSLGADSLGRSAQDAQDVVSKGLAVAKDTVSAGFDNWARHAANAGTALVDGSNQLRDKGATLLSSASESVGALARKAGAATDLAATQITSGAAVADDFVEESAGRVGDLGVHAARQIRDSATEATHRTGKLISEVIQQNPLLVGGAGLAVGALLASALPPSDVERELLGGASAGVQKLASDTASQGFETAKGIVSDVFSDVAHKADEQGLSVDGLSDAARELGRRARHVAENAATTAFELAGDNAAMSPKRGSLL
jgi:hypothetical protein